MQKRIYKKTVTEEKERSVTPDKIVKQETGEVRRVVVFDVDGAEKEVDMPVYVDVLVPGKKKIEVIEYNIWCVDVDGETAEFRNEDSAKKYYEGLR